MKGVLLPLGIGLAIRLALAPWFMHGWDMTTTMISSQQVLSGINPYTYLAQQSSALAKTGVSTGYYGFAYLATTLVVYTPFYWIYTALGFAHLPLLGWQGQVGQQLGLVYPDAFAFLTIMKLPVIAADCAAIYLLYRKNSRAGWAYALSPYAIVITSAWGNFDPLVGVLLLVSYLAFEKNKAASGFAYGLSLMKIYTIVAAPAYLLSLWKKPKELLAFLAGCLVANIPSIYYLVADPSGFLYALGFQASRPVSGVNIYYPLTVLSNILLEQQASLVVVGILVVTLVKTCVAIWRYKVDLKESIILLMLVYVVFAPVSNEQLLAALLPLGLLAKNFSHKLTIFPLVFIAFNASYIYYAAPIFFQSASLQSVWQGALTWWGGAVGAYASQMRYLMGALMGVGSLLMARTTFLGPLKIRLGLPPILHATRERVKA